MRRTIAKEKRDWLLAMVTLCALAISAAAEDRSNANYVGNAASANNVDRSFNQASHFDSPHTVSAPAIDALPTTSPPLYRPSDFSSNDTNQTARGQSPDRGAPLPLAPPTKQTSSGAGRSQSRTPTGALTTVMGSLAIVLGLFLLVVWFTRRALPNAAASLPKEVVEVLGRSALANRQQLQLVRVGKKLLLLCMSATGVDTLTEIDEPEEVDRLAGLCQQSQPDSITSTFRQVLSQFGSGAADAAPQTRSLESVDA